MTISTQTLIHQVHDSDAGSILVRGRNVPLESIDSVVTLDAGVKAVHEWTNTYLPLYVTTPMAGGRARKRFGTQTVPAAIEHIEQLLTEREFKGFWLRNHAGFVNCWHERRVNPLEAQLAAIAAKADTMFVTWTDATATANEEIYDEIYDGVDEP